jgi:hypothetical protein
VFLRRGGGETRKIETEPVPSKIRGGNAAGVALSRFSNLSDITTIDTVMKME